MRSPQVRYVLLPSDPGHDTQVPSKNKEGLAGGSVRMLLLRDEDLRVE